MAALEPRHELPPSALRLWRLHTLAMAASLCALALAVGLWWWPGRWTTLAAWLAVGFILVEAVVSWVWLLPGRYRAYRYQLDAQAFVLRDGVLFSSHVVVPGDQILYVDMRQGPLGRALGLSTIALGTLGSVHHLGPLDADVARTLVDGFRARGIDASQ